MSDLIKSILPGVSTKYSGNLYTANLPKSLVEDIDDPTPSQSGITRTTSIKTTASPAGQEVAATVWSKEDGKIVIPSTHIEVDINTEKVAGSCRLNLYVDSTSVVELSLNGAVTGMISLDVTGYKRTVDESTNTYYIRVNGFTKVEGGVSYGSLFTKTYKYNDISSMPDSCTVKTLVNSCATPGYITSITSSDDYRIEL